MGSQANRRRRFPMGAAELHEDDGVDPRRFLSRITAGAADTRKALQVCKLAQRAIAAALACDMKDPLLSDLEVVAVHPLRGGAMLEVELRFGGGERGVSADAALARLAQVRGYLRAQVAESLRRRKAPELRFTLSAGGAGEIGGPHGEG